MHFPPRSAAVIVAVLAATGCDLQKVEESVKSGAEETVQVVEQTVETVQQETGLAGSMELATDPPLAAKACYAELVDTGEGRPNVLRLASYESTELERFPSMMLQAHIEESTLAALGGKSVQANVYAQREKDGPVWSSPIGSPATVSILSVDNKKMTCECAGAVLVNSQTDEQSTVSGKFVALLP